MRPARIGWPTGRTPRRYRKNIGTGPANRSCSRFSLRLFCARSVIAAPRLAAARPGLARRQLPRAISFTGLPKTCSGVEPGELPPSSSHSIPATVELATQARPYSLAIAAVAASSWTLYRWVDSRGRGWLCGLHRLLGPDHLVSLSVQRDICRRMPSFYAANSLRAAASAASVSCSSAYAVIALLVTPLLPHMRLLLQESHTLPFGPKPVAVSLAELLMPPVFIAVVFVAGLLVHFAGPPSTSGIVQTESPRRR